ncbi:Single-stranded DNA-binding protein 3 [Larimichthys crocea]|uniref:Uncharacterized protein n=1 Tax=Larimichthys crocea TaxID=215358 RepID=A0ACD3RKE1_LARCR|nr:Single-stranded DNA-binding protein 3 [Larimichthys crocea]
MDLLNSFATGGRERERERRGRERETISCRGYSYVHIFKVEQLDLILRRLLKGDRRAAASHWLPAASVTALAPPLPLRGPGSVESSGLSKSSAVGVRGEGRGRDDLTDEIKKKKEKEATCDTKQCSPKAKAPRCRPDGQAREKLALYVYEYLLHIGAQKSAQTFLSEIRWEKNITLGEPPGFLHSWWCVFWDLYCAAPERRETCDHSSEAKAFHDYSAAAAPSPVMGGMPPW